MHYLPFTVNRHVDEETLIKAYMMAWNTVLDNRDSFLEKWEKQIESQDLLEKYHAKKLIEYIGSAKKREVLDVEGMLSTLDHTRVCIDGTLIVILLDGMEIEYRNDEYVKS